MLIREEEEERVIRSRRTTFNCSSVSGCSGSFMSGVKKLSCLLLERIFRGCRFRRLMIRRRMWRILVFGGLLCGLLGWHCRVSFWGKL
jgi:hypothetical protein